MGRFAWWFVACIVSICALPDRLSAQDWVPPRDGAFHIEAKPAFAFKASLVEHWVNPNMGTGTLHLYAPIMPELPGQRKVSTRLAIPGSAKLKPDELLELSESERPMLALHMNSDDVSPRIGVTARLEYDGVLYSRTLKSGATPQAIPL